MPVKPIPDGYHSLTPYLTIQGAGKLIDFMKQAFGAEELSRSPRPDGTIAHAQLRIGDSMLMLAEATEQWKPMPCAVYLYVKDTDSTYKRALQAGATSLMEPADQFYGDRGAGVRDPSGNCWYIGTHVEDVSPSEMKKREEAYFKDHPKS
jgi:PhnB protein